MKNCICFLLIILSFGVGATQPTTLPVGPTVLDSIIDKAQAGDKVSQATLGTLSSGTYQLNRGVNITLKGLVIRAPKEARLICPSLGSDPKHPGTVWSVLAPNFTLDGFHVDEKVGTYIVVKGADCNWQNSTITGATVNGFVTGGPGSGVVDHVDNGGVRFHATNITIIHPCDASAGFLTRNDFVLTNVITPGSYYEIGVRVDTPNGLEQPTGTVSGGRYTNYQSQFGKAAFSVRQGKVTLKNGVYVGGNLGAGQTYLPGNPLLPKNLKPADFATISAIGCTFDMALPGCTPSNNDIACISVNEGAILNATGCNFINIGPYPHRMPVSFRADGTSSGWVKKCFGNAPSLTSSGGTEGHLLPPKSVGTEDGNVWFWSK